MNVYFKLGGGPPGSDEIITKTFPDELTCEEAVMDFYSTIYAGLATVRPLTKDGSCEINVYAEGPIRKIVHERAVAYVYKKQPKCAT